MTVSTARLSDDRFLEALRTGELPPGDFRHGDHLRLAWILLHKHPLPGALREIRVTIRAFGAHHGVENAYNETVTTAWALLISTHREATFEEFLSSNEARLGIGLLHKFWTPEALASDRAKHSWLDPDRRSLSVLSSRKELTIRSPQR